MARDEQGARQARMRVLQPISATLVERGVSQTWLADRLGADRYSISKWLHGVHRVPDGFIARACAALNIPVSLIVIPEPRDLYIQQPRAKRTPATPKPKGGRAHGNNANTSSASDHSDHDTSRRVRRGQRPAAIPGVAPSPRARS